MNLKKISLFFLASFFTLASFAAIQQEEHKHKKGEKCEKCTQKDKKCGCKAGKCKCPKTEEKSEQK